MKQLLLLALFGAVGGLALGAAEFHVAVNGSDANPGTETQPFATLTCPRGHESPEEGTAILQILTSAAGKFRAWLGSGALKVWRVPQKRSG